MLKRLEKLHAEVERTHAGRVQAATACGMNSARIQRCGATPSRTRGPSIQSRNAAVCESRCSRRTKEVAQHGLVALSAGAEVQRAAHGEMLLDENGQVQLANTATQATQPVSADSTEIPAGQHDMAAGQAPTTGVRTDKNGQVLGWAVIDSKSGDDGNASGEVRITSQLRSKEQ